MKIYETVEDFNAETGASASRQGEAGAREADWDYRIAAAVPGKGEQGGWLLVTGFPIDEEAARANGGKLPAWLYAYEIDSHDLKTGRIALLNRKWSQVLDDKFFPIFNSADSQMRAQNGGPLMLEEIDALIQQNLP